jgi:hypothetical protein
MGRPGIIDTTQQGVLQHLFQSIEYAFFEGHGHVGHAAQGQRDGLGEAVCHGTTVLLYLNIEMMEVWMDGWMD